jgi:hypothetical protein
MPVWTVWRQARYVYPLPAIEPRFSCLPVSILVSIYNMQLVLCFINRSYVLIHEDLFGRGGILSGLLTSLLGRGEWTLSRPYSFSH